MSSVVQMSGRKGGLEPGEKYFEFSIYFLRSRREVLKSSVVQMSEWKRGLEPGKKYFEFSICFLRSRREVLKKNNDILVYPVSLTVPEYKRPLKRILQLQLEIHILMNV